MTTQIAVSGQDGAGNPVTIRADQNVDNSIAFRHSLEVGGAAVSTANAVPVSGVPMASVVSSGLEPSHILKVGAGTLYGFQASFTVSGWIMLFDATTAPVDGAVVPRKVWQVSAAQSQTLDKAFNPPLAMAAGAVLVFSTTGPLTKTASASAYFSGEIQ